jgi:hypothetical protein
MVPFGHELLLSGILNPLDLQLFPPDRAPQDTFHDAIRATLDFCLERVRQSLGQAEAAMRLESAFEGQKNPRFIKLLHPPIALANPKALSLQRIDPLHVQLFSW